jgi:hypothetical protein
MFEDHVDVEVETITEVERLEALAREARRRVDHAANAAERPVLIRQVEDLEQEVARLRNRIH